MARNNGSETEYSTGNLIVFIQTFAYFLFLLTVTNYSSISSIAYTVYKVCKYNKLFSFRMVFFESLLYISALDLKQRLYSGY